MHSVNFSQLHHCFFASGSKKKSDFKEHLRTGYIPLHNCFCTTTLLGGEDKEREAVEAGNGDWSFARKVFLGCVRLEQIPPEFGVGSSELQVSPKPI